MSAIDIPFQVMINNRINISLRKALLYFKTFLNEIFRHATVIKMSAYYELNGSLQKNNWGDDINYWFLKEIACRPIISYDWSLLTRYSSRSYILGIGSLITLVPLRNSIIWGSGVMSSTDQLIGRPREVRAVRGPLSRKRLLENGIACPEIYGDPALLLPLYYNPNVDKKYKLGIILHYKDQEIPYFDDLRNDPSVIFIKIRDYEHWLDFVDDICRCESIVSSSLHGLIVSEAYGVPNLWIKFPRNYHQDDIKFHDFFLSLGHDRFPYILMKNIDKTELLSQLKNYQKGTIDIQPLLASCPFKIKRNIKISR